jgi:hypothetical protein
MGFNRRIIDIMRMRTHSSIQNGFESFDSYMLRGDAYSFSDPLSGIVWDFYSSSDESNRRRTCETITDGSDFFEDLVKFFSVLDNDKNEEIHFESIEKYYELLSNKWKDNPNKIEIINYLYERKKPNY